MNRRAIAGTDYGKKGSRRAEVRALVERWRDVLYLDLYTIDVILEPKAAYGDGRLADASQLREYAQIVVRAYPELWAPRITPRDRSLALLHELCHTITHEQKSLTFDALNERLVRQAEVNDANERATDWIARIIFSLCEGE